MYILILILAIVLALSQGYSNEEFYFGLANITVWSIIICVLIYPFYNWSMRKLNKKSDKAYGKMLLHALKEMKEAEPMIERLEEKKPETLKLSLDEQYEYIQSVKDFQFKVDELKEPYQEIVRNLSLKSEEEDTLNILKKTLDRINKSYSKQIETVVDLNKKTKFITVNNAYQKAFEKTYDYDSIKLSYLHEEIEALKKEKSNIIWRVSKGVEGENSVIKSIKAMMKDNYLLENVRIEHNNQSAESDVIIVGPTGLYTLEVKNEGSAGTWSTRISPDGQWQKVYKDGNRAPMKDHGSQMNHHIAVQERFLNEKLKEIYGEDAPFIPMRGAIVIANDNLIVDNESDLVVLRKSSINRFIEKGTDQIDELWQSRIKDIFEEHSLPGKRYEISNIEAMTENLILDTLRVATLYKLKNEWLREWATREDVIYQGSGFLYFKVAAMTPIFPEINLKEGVFHDK